MPVTWKRIAYFDEIGGLSSKSRFEQGLGEQLQPADGFTLVHMGGLFDADSNGGLMPATGTDTDTFFTLNGSDDIQPSA